MGKEGRRQLFYIGLAGGGGRVASQEYAAVAVPFSIRRARKGNQTDGQHSAWPRGPWVTLATVRQSYKESSVIWTNECRRVLCLEKCRICCVANNVAALSIHRARLPSFGPSPFRVLDDTDNGTIRCPDYSLSHYAKSLGK